MKDVFLWLIVAWYIAGMIIAQYMVGKPREPITQKLANVTIITQGIFVTLILFIAR